MIPQGIILFWFGSVANIPAGWQRVTALDGLFPRSSSDASPPNVSGGSTTHTHVSPAHTHVMQNHTHSGTTSRNGDYENDGGGSQASRDQHVHGFTSSTTEGGNLVDGFTYGAANSVPPYVGFIPITPSATFSPLREDIYALFAGAELPIDWDMADGDNDTTDCRNLYLRGASTDADAGETGGSLAHSHDVSHNHTARDHTHTGVTGGSSDGVREYGTNPNGGAVVPLHSHNFSLNATTVNTNAYSGSVSVSDQQPAFKKLALIKNNSGHVSLPKGIIGMWLGNIADIPIGWFYCNGDEDTQDMRGRYPKVAATLGEIGEIGGANSHAHGDSNSHTHSATGAHSHTGGTDWRGEQGSTGASNNGASKGHSHQITSTSATTPAWNGASFQGLENDAQPPFKTVAFVEYRYSMGGGAVIGFL